MNFHSKSMRNRILIIGKPDSGQLDLVKELTGSLPETPDDGSYAGISHDYRIETKYYSTDCIIWMDEFYSSSELDDWVESFSSEEASEVRDVLSAVVLCIADKNSQDDWKNQVKSFSRFIELLENELWDGVSVVFERRDDEDEEKQHEIFEHGLEAVFDYSRIKEAIEANSYGGGDDESNKQQEPDEIESEIKDQLESLIDGSDKQVKDIEYILKQLQAAKLIEDEEMRYKECERIAGNLLDFE